MMMASTNKSFICQTCSEYYQSQGQQPLEFNSKASYAKHLKSLEHKKVYSGKPRPDVNKRNRVIQAAQNQDFLLMGAVSAKQEQAHFKKGYGRCRPSQQSDVGTVPPTSSSYWD